MIKIVKVVGMTPGYARCRGGGRIPEGTPQGHWKILAMLGAMSAHGMLAMMTVEAATDTDIFLAYLGRVRTKRCRFALP